MGKSLRMSTYSEKEEDKGPKIIENGEFVGKL